MRLISATGHRIAVLGTADIEIQVEGLRFQHDFVVVRFPELDQDTDGVIGLDFLRKFHFRWELGKDKIYYKEKQIDLQPVVPPVTVRIIQKDPDLSDDKPDDPDAIPELRNYILSIMAANREINPDLKKADISPDELLDQAHYTHFQPEGESKPFKEYFALDHIEPQTRSNVLEVLEAYADIFLIPGQKLKCTPLIEHSIDTGDSDPVFKRPYPVPYALRGELRSQIQKMLDDGIIAPSTSAWSSPILLVKKKGGTPEKPLYRPVIDYRGLNAVTKRDRMPMNSIQEVMDSLNGARLFTTIDMAYGYWQIKVKDSDREKTAFATPFGLYEALKMPFGLCNAPATFCRLMAKVLRTYINKFCFVYLDDVIIFSKTKEEHIQHLKQIFNAFRKANLMLKPEKGRIMAESVEFLGHIISADGIKPHQDKIKGLLNPCLAYAHNEVNTRKVLINNLSKSLKEIRKMQFRRMLSNQ